MSVQGVDRLTARTLRVGDEVELVLGKYAGIKGKVTAKRPARTSFATFIMVNAELPKYDDPSYETLRSRFNRWQRAAAWKRTKNS